MTTNLRSMIHAELGWTWKDELGTTRVVNSNRLKSIQTLLDGADEGEADAVWDAAGEVLASGNSTTLQLDALEKDLFGDTLVVSLLTVKALMIVNQDTGTGGYLLLGGAATDAWEEPFGSSGDRIKVMPGAPVLLTCPGEGWDVDSGSTNLKIEAVGGAVTFDIALLGTVTEPPGSS